MQGKLNEATATLDNLYLDPNNPRFADLAPMARAVKPERVIEDSVQKKAMDSILNDRFDVNQLKESIQNIGFLPVDRLVAVELPQSNKFMIVEGNRRLAALKSLMADVESGEIDLEPEVEESLKKIPILVIEADSTTERDHFARVLQGVRHVSSVKSWGPYQQAQLITMMIEDGREIPEIKETLGLSTVRVNSLRRSYYGLKQMQKDADFGEFAKPEMFSHFEEGYKQMKLRNWMDWDDEANQYKNDDHRHTFYSWLIPYEEDGVKYSPKVVDSKELRAIGKLMDNAPHFSQFCDSPSLQLVNAVRGVADDVIIDWRSILRNDIKALKQIPALELSSVVDSDVELLRSVQALCDQLIQQVTLIKENSTQS